MEHVEGMTWDMLMGQMCHCGDPRRSHEDAPEGLGLGPCTACFHCERFEWIAALALRRAASFPVSFLAKKHISRKRLEKATAEAAELQKYFGSYHDYF